MLNPGGIPSRPSFHTLPPQDMLELGAQHSNRPVNVLWVSPTPPSDGKTPISSFASSLRSSESRHSGGQEGMTEGKERKGNPSTGAMSFRGKEEPQQDTMCRLSIVSLPSSLPTRPTVPSSSSPSSLPAKPVLPALPASVNTYFVPPPIHANDSTTLSHESPSSTPTSLPLKPKIKAPHIINLVKHSAFLDVKVESPEPSSDVDQVEGSGNRASPHSRPSNSQMLPPPLPSAKALGKRKASDVNEDDVQRNRTISPKRSSSVVSDIKPSLPISLLPMPIPSKRFKKRPTSKAVLLPVEQLPVYALPPLPQVNDSDLLKTVFTHCSLFEKAKGRFEEPEDNPAKHYEKLEHVGDSILGMIVTTWLHELKPRLTCGTGTKLKAHLVSNATLSHLSGLYGFPQRLTGDPNLLPMLRAHTDVRAALMEAYIAALYFSFPADQRISIAMPILDRWLREMYEPLVDFFFTYMKKEHDQHNAAVGASDDGSVIVMDEEEMERIDKAAQGMGPLVQMYANQQERELVWEEDRFETTIGILWRIRCVVDGIELGEATRAGKKAAKNVAGWEAAKKLGLTTG